MALNLQSKHSLTAQTLSMIAQSRKHAFSLFPEKNTIDSINSGTKTGFALR